MRFAKRQQNAGLPTHVYMQVENLESAASDLLDVLDGHAAAYDSPELYRLAFTLRQVVDGLAPNAEFRPLDAASSRPVAPGTPG